MHKDSEFDWGRNQSGIEVNQLPTCLSLPNKNQALIESIFSSAILSLFLIHQGEMESIHWKLSQNARKYQFLDELNSIKWKERKFNSETIFISWHSFKGAKSYKLRDFE